MLLTLKLDITEVNEEQREIINELKWHVEKAYNTLLHEIRMNERKIDLRKSLNILRKYIKNNIPNLEIAMDNGREQRPIKRRVA